DEWDLPREITLAASMHLSKELSILKTAATKEKKENSTPQYLSDS
ncbi:2246_t:CDS:1, partial [Racocetra persica]